MIKEKQIIDKIVQLQSTVTIDSQGKTDIMKEAKKAFYISALLYVLGKREDLEL